LQMRTSESLMPGRIPRPVIYRQVLVIPLTPTQC
jgi:hypothetical protein